MKKIALALVAILLVAAFATACSDSADTSSATPDAAATEEVVDNDVATEPADDAADETAEVIDEDTVIRVGASPTPHAEILAQIEQALADKGYGLEVVEFTDYIQPNVALDGGDLDANYFQHITYLNDYNTENGTDLVSAAGIHYEPFAIYAGKTTDLASLADGAQVAVPNDPTNEARALLLLEEQGLITLNPEAGLAATKLDVTENPKNLDIVEIEAAQLARSLPDVDIAVINGNYALQAGLSPTTDALAVESQDSDTAVAYTNVIAVRNGDEETAKIQALVEALQTDEIAQFMADNYNGAVVAVFGNN